jgi:hypothetical protein
MAPCRLRVLVLALVLPACPPQQGGTATEPGTEAMPTTQSEPPTTGSPPTTSTTTTDSTSAEPTTAGDELKRCASRCQIDRDCLVGGMNYGFRCLDGLCLYPPCSSDVQCLADLSGWKQPCAGQAECAAVEACVEVEGAGRCALKPGMFSCADFGLVEVQRAPIEGGRPLTVCGQELAVCEAGECSRPCTSDESCPAAMGHPRCEPESGRCVCEFDQDCLDSGLPGFVRCVEGRCGCASDSDCAGGQNVDTCYAGVCGCSSDAACTAQVFDGAPLSCE